MPMATLISPAPETHPRSPVPIPHPNVSIALVGDKGDDTNEIVSAPKNAG